MPAVLFICTGNVIRSPFAEHLFRKLLDDSTKELSAWQITSSGTWTRAGLPTSSKVRRAARHWGVNLDEHRSTPLNKELLIASNLVLTMESGQKEAIRHEFSDQANKVMLLSELTGEGFDIEDPIGFGPQGISVVLGKIDSLLREQFDEICSLAIKES